MKHASLIPIGPHQGKIMVIASVQYCGIPDNETRVLDWAVVDPATWVFQNFRTLLPPGQGDLFCSGHAWLPNGRLLVAGGTTYWGNCPNAGPGWGGSKLVMEFDPTVPLGSSSWVQRPDLDSGRWYPSVVGLGTSANVATPEAFIVAGGSNYAPYNSYQAYNVALGTWQASGHIGQGTYEFVGPGGGVDFSLYDYPRMHLLSNGLGLTAGFGLGSSLLDHYQLRSTNANTRWEPNDNNWRQSVWREYGTSVLFPISIPAGVQDRVLSIGGLLSGAIQDNVELCRGSSMGPEKYWTDPSNAFPDLIYKRWFLNAVLLPDSTVLVVGGEQSGTDYGCAIIPAYAPELYRAGAWRTMKATNIIRDYHSTALLLPNGKVFTAGGDSRRYLPRASCTATPPLLNLPCDYQVFVPHYLNCGIAQPVITNSVPPGAAMVWPKGSTQMVDYTPLPVGVTISRVVLVRAGSVTHHHDPNQRVVELSFLHVVDTDPPTPGYQPRLSVTVPNSHYLVPKGHYMLFILNNHGTPSEAKWVDIQ